MAKLKTLVRSHPWISIIVCGVILSIVAFVLLRIFTGVAAEKVYPDLAQPEETEAPSTFTTYPSSQATEAIIGGQGTGLNCSIPELAGKIAFKPVKNGSAISLRFRQACVMHDLCYRHGYATYGYTQSDCDSQLQQSVYRLCRQINSQGNLQSPLSMYAACEHEAKEVLLGVTLGGAGSFHSRKSSTYFEYDPQPGRADNYIVGRAVPQDAVSDAARDFGVRTFYFRRNTVKMRVLSTPPQSGSAVAFPDALLATPPVLIDAADDEQINLPPLVSLARNSFTETSVHLIPFFISRQQAADKAGYELTLPSCPGAACSLDADASINKFAIIDGKPVLVALSHRGALSRNKTTVKIKQQAFLLDKSSKEPMSDYALNGPAAAIHNQYRFLSHDMLLERNASGKVERAWAFARGVQVSADGKEFIRDDSGKDYATRVVVARQKLGNGHTDDIQRFSLNAAETDEPLSLIRLGKEQGVALVGLAWSAADLRRVERGEPAKNPPLLKLWRLPQNGGAPDARPQALSLPVPVPNGYISLPPVIVRLSTQDAPLMVLTRIAPDRWQGENGQEKTLVKTDTLAIDFLITSLPGNAARKNYFANSYQLRCELGLDKQLQSPEASSVRQRAYRTIFGYYSAALEAKNPPWQINHIKSDLAQRWRMSQLIVSERQLTEKGPVMALTMVFNGFPAMSFQVLLKNDNGQLSYLPSAAQPRFLNRCALTSLAVPATRPESG